MPEKENVDGLVTVCSGIINIVIGDIPSMLKITQDTVFKLINNIM